jgi:hypothetical protein
MIECNKNSVKEWAQTTIDMNPDKGVITAVREAVEFFGLKATEEEINQIAFGVVV